MYIADILDEEIPFDIFRALFYRKQYNNFNYAFPQESEAKQSTINRSQDHP